MKKIDFWIKASNYSIFICGIVLIAEMFFTKYLGNITMPILFVGVLALIIFLISELMKFILKKRS